MPQRNGGCTYGIERLLRLKTARGVESVREEVKHDMLRRDRFLTVLIAALFVLSTRANAQVCKEPQTSQPVCKEPAPVCAPAPAAPVCPAPVCKAPAPIVREKPAIAAPPMFERNLPKVWWVQQERAVRAAEVLDEFARSHPGLANSARAIAVIPSTKKVAFVFGARWGSGLLSMPDGQCGWIPPSYIHFRGGNFGPQVGIQSTDLVLVFFSEDAVRSLLNGKLTLNGTASAAAGPWGRDLNAGVTITMASGILAFSRARGVFAGASLDGSAVTIDDTSNQNVYGQFVRGEDILTRHRVARNEAVAPFMDSLDANLSHSAQRAAQRAQQASTSTAITSTPTN